MENTLILNNKQIEQKIKRIAYQIYENNIDEKEIFIAGIAQNGHKLAQRLKKELDTISDLSIVIGKLTLDKKNPLKTVSCDAETEVYQEKSVILVDDVLNSGSTLIYGTKYFLDVPLKKLQTVVLVDRSHKRFPIKADFKGISLSTSLSETVKVTFSTKNKVELG